VAERPCATRLSDPECEQFSKLRTTGTETTISYHEFSSQVSIQAERHLFIGS